jgi:putative ABC transport system permease protein
MSRWNADDEIRSYLEHETQLLIDRGMPPEEARRAALRRLGNRGRIQEEIYYQSRPAFLDALWRDIRYALRNLRRSKRFAILAVLSLALGIGVNSAMFSVICGEVYPRWPYRDYLGILRVVSFRPNPPGRFNLTRRDWEAIRSGAHAYSELAAQEVVSFNTAAPSGPPERINGMRVTPNFFRFLGVSPALGRDLREDDRQAAVIGDAYWERHFGRSPAALGATLRLDGESYTVVGVLPRWFHWLSWHNTGCGSATSPDNNCLDVYVPSRFEIAPDAAQRSLMVLGRAAPGVTAPQADAEARAIAAHLQTLYPDTHRNWSARVETLDHSLHNLAPGFIVMQAAVGFVLLIACANVGSLLLARGSARSREMAVRAAIGASRGRLMQQMVTEGAVLAALAAVTGLGLAAVGGRLMARSAGLDIFGSGIDWRVTSFTLACSVFSVLLFALFPAAQISRIGTAEGLRRAGRTFSAGRGTSRMRSGLVAAEIALSLVLLIGAGLMARSFAAQLAIPLGFDPANLLFAQLPTKDASALGNVLARVRRMPGVVAAEYVSRPPVWSSATVSIALPGDGRHGDELPRARYRAAGLEYFRTLGIRLERGREFAASDAGRAVAVVSSSLAVNTWPGADPIGRQLLLFGGGAPAKVEVIGVMADVKHYVLEESHAELVVLADPPAGSPYLVARVRSNPAAFLPALQKVVAAVDPDLPVGELATFEAARERQLIEIQASMYWLEVFSALAMALAAVGIYGVISYTVAQRRQEIGVRMALGAGRAQIAGMVLAQTARLAVAGVAAGLGLGSVATRALGRAALHDVSHLDPATYAVSALFLLAVAMGAAIVPLRASMRVDPVEALRTE